MNTIEKLLKDPETPATILNCLCLKQYGPSYYSWEPETLRIEIGEGIHEINFDKLQAIGLLLATDRFYDQWEVFEKIGCAFTGNRVYFDAMQPLRSYETVWTIIESRLNDDTPRSFSDDVESYINTTFKADGLLITPKFIHNIYDSYRVKDPPLSEDIIMEQKKKMKLIEEYCKEKLRKIIDLSIDVFHKNILDRVKEELKLIVDE